MHTPHTALEVTATRWSRRPTPAPPPEGATWELLRSDAARDEHVELLSPSARAAPDDALLAVAAQAGAAEPVRDGAGRWSSRVHEHVAYRPGTTGVSTSAVEAWQLGAGVCQDIAHVSLALLRAVGHPGRYVSGYLHPGGEGAAIGETVAGESHAWVEAWLGTWWAFDPTNGVPAGERHVVVARGRDYGDVPPLKGVYAGGGSQSLGVASRSPGSRSKAPARLALRPDGCDGVATVALQRERRSRGSTMGRAHDRPARSSGTSASSRTSTTASRRWPTGCCSSPGSSTRGTCGRSTSTRWTSSASAASPSRRRTSGCRGGPTTAATTSST